MFNRQTLRLIWRDYRTELTSEPLLWPAANPKIPARLRPALHYFVTTLRFLSYYLFFRPVAWLIIHAISDFHLRGVENIPAEGAIGTWNHLSQLDPMIGVLVSPRPPYVMTKSEYFATPLMGGVVGFLGGFPVRRGSADRQAIKTAMTVLKREELLGIFPEGTRSKTFQLQQAHPGAAMLATLNDTLVIPIAVWGTENVMRRNKLGLLKRPRVEVICGPAYRLKEAAAEFAAAHNLPATGKKGRHDNLEFLSDVLMLKIADLLPPAYRGEFTPEKIAARHATPAANLQV